MMIRKILNRWLERRSKPQSPVEPGPERRQVALPLRADLPLRERSRSLVAVPAQINGARMGSGEF